MMLRPSHLTFGTVLIALLQACANDSRPNESNAPRAAGAGATAASTGGQAAVTTATGGASNSSGTGNSIGSGGDVAGFAGAAGFSTNPACDSDARALGNPLSEYALEVARAADPELAFQVMIMLPEPGSVVGLTVEQRKEMLAPSQDPIEAHLVQHGATNIQRFWLINAFAAVLQAKYVPSVLCWPSVISVEPQVTYWEVAARPWDLSSVGTAECPSNNGSCPAHCVAMTGVPYDLAQDCLGPGEIVACSIFELGGQIGGTCHASTDKGKVYCQVPSFTPMEPSYLGWRACTADEELLCSQALARRCP